MKKLFLLGAAAVIFATGCEETPPVINFHGTPGFVDTTYTEASIPAAQAHNILFEEFTGATCPNCPAAHDLLKTIQDAHPGRINVVGLYPQNVSQNKPPAGAKYDFRSMDAQNILDEVMKGMQGEPSAGIDRLELSSVASAKIALLSSDWTSNIDPLLVTQDTMNVDMTSSYDEGTGTATVIFKTTFLKNSTDQYNFTIALLEDSLVDKQERGSSIEDNYLFLNVCKAFVTSGMPFGQTLAPKLTAKPAGTVYMATYKYHVPSNVLNPKNCRLVGYVHRSQPAGGTHVYQSVQCKLAP